MARRVSLYAVLLLSFAANAMVWVWARPLQAKWVNVPPPPPAYAAAVGTLGDRQLAYRAGGLMLQNFGSSGGRSLALSDYDYPMLGRWFMLEDTLDPHSSFVPYLAAFYYGATQTPKELKPVVDYLAYIGRRPETETVSVQPWRWLGQAIYLARFRMGDLSRALDLANELAALDRPNMPAWTRQMPVLIMNAKGDKAAAYALMMSILKDGSGHMQKAEVNFMIWYICRRILDRAEADKDPVCISNPEALK